MKNLIGISGKIGSGKDTVANIMQYIVWCETVNSSDLPDFKYWCESTELTFPVAGWEVKKFAAKLKQIVCLLTGCTMEDLESQEFKAQELPAEWNGMTYRIMLQKVGTEAMRGQLHDQVWVNSLFADYKNKAQIAIETTGGYTNDPNPTEFPKWIISDMRFPNEMEAVKSRGGFTIRINRAGWINKRDEHPSETALDNAKFDYIINNDGTIEELIDKVEAILKELEII